ncbi:MAG: hypothetical protein ABEI32_13520 [Halothece sp.]|jgi:hypothetical protein
MSYFFLSEPPYLLLLFGILISVACGTAFEKVLKNNVQKWYQTPKSEKPDSVQTPSLFLPFVGICLGIFFFLGAGLEVVINAWKISVAIALPLTLITGRLVWSQLGKLLIKLQQGGSQALDLEDLF